MYLALSKPHIWKSEFIQQYLKEWLSSLYKGDICLREDVVIRLLSSVDFSCIESVILFPRIFSTYDPSWPSLLRVAELVLRILCLSPRRSWLVGPQRPSALLLHNVAWWGVERARRRRPGSKAKQGSGTTNRTGDWTSCQPQDVRQARPPKHPGFQFMKKRE